ncbi:MAG TPA: MASE1 domain-containing protein [Gemmatimonadaceae bacterium]|nr:MASE1 domain-containing protein [Gemmatimonadaceae bacterium]
MSNTTIRWDDWIHPTTTDVTSAARGARGLWRLRAVRPVIAAIVVSLAYYLGAVVGFLFQAPGVPQSVLWLPNSILLAALLLNPVNRWAPLLAAAFPAHMLVGWQNHAPPLSMSLIFLTNCADAALGAGLLRLLTRNRWSLRNLNELILFLIVGAVLAPLLVSFLDAGITVETGWGSAYWLAFTTRVRANALTNMIVVPAIVASLSADVDSSPRAIPRVIEAALLLAGLFVVSMFVFSARMKGQDAFHYVPVAFLLWAAVRFGPGMEGWSLLVLAATMSWYALHGGGVFGETPSHAAITSLQLFLVVVAIPLLCLSMVVKDRAETLRELTVSRNAVRVSIDTVRDLAGRLIAAQDEERTRVARELHDGVSQHVAELAITLSSMRRTPAVRNAGLENEFLRLYDQTSGLFESVRSLSHQLHPSVLRHAGLVPALRGLCDAFSEQGTLCAFTAGDVEPLSDELALVAYRVIQEALRNVNRHARAEHVSVSLGRAGSALTIVVADDGGGFDPVSARQRSHGLGLVSMEERVRSVRGEMHIRSSPAGSTIDVKIPVSAWAT